MQCTSMVREYLLPVGLPCVCDSGTIHTSSPSLHTHTQTHTHTHTHSHTHTHTQVMETERHLYLVTEYASKGEIFGKYFNSSKITNA